MVLLPGDVIPHRFDLRKSDGKNSITVLPGKSCNSALLVLIQSDEPRLTSLTIAAASQVRDKAHKKMNMVFDAANNNGLAIEVGQDSAEISVQFFAQWFVAQKWAAVFGGKDRVNQIFASDCGMG